MTYVIAEPCVDLKDLSCVEECPVDCIYIGASMAYIHPDECVDCGACEPVCPVEAIFYEDDVPIKWAPYIDANDDFFEQLGSPGGASRIGPLPFDAPQVKSGQEPVIQERVVGPLAFHEGSTPGLFDIIRRGRRPGHAIAVPSVAPERALNTAMYLLFDGVLSIGERTSTSVAQVVLDSAVLPFGQVSVSEMIKGAIATRPAELLRDLRVEPSKVVRQAVRYRAAIECAGQPITKVSYLHDKEAVSLVGNLIPLLLRSVLRRSGGDVQLVTTSFEYASFIRMAMTVHHSEKASAFDPEIVLPDLSQVPQPLVAAFRDSHRDDLADHVTRMAGLTSENAALENPDDRRRHWVAARNEMADRGSKLWRLARATFPGVRGDIALGITGGLLSRRPWAEPSIVERLFDAAGLVLPQDEPAQVFFLTTLGHKWLEHRYRDEDRSYRVGY